MIRKYALLTLVVITTCVWISCNHQEKSIVKDQPNTSPSLASASPLFSSFLENFPAGKYPISITDKHVKEINLKGPPFSKIEALAFVCDVPGSSLNCPTEKGPTAQKGPAIYDAIFPHRLIKKADYYILLYHLAKNRYHEIYLATYSPKGKMISRIHFAGSDEHSDLAFNGVLRIDNSIKVTGIQYALDMKYSEDKNEIYDSNTTSYQILANGKIKNLTTNKEVTDEPFESVN